MQLASARSVNISLMQKDRTFVSYTYRTLVYNSYCCVVITTTVYKVKIIYMYRI